MQKINDKQPKALKLYGKFIIQIINDEQKGNELLSYAKKLEGDNTNNNLIDIAAGGDQF